LRSAAKAILAFGAPSIFLLGLCRIVASSALSNAERRPPQLSPVVLFPGSTSSIAGDHLAGPPRASNRSSRSLLSLDRIRVRHGICQSQLFRARLHQSLWQESHR